LKGLSALLAYADPQRFAFFNSLTRRAYESVEVKRAEKLGVFACVERRAIGLEHLQWP
jgi:hypothetical protein